MMMNTEMIEQTQKLSLSKENNYQSILKLHNTTKMETKRNYKIANNDSVQRASTDDGQQKTIIDKMKIKRIIWHLDARDK